MTDQIVTQEEHLAALGKYEYGWADADTAGATAQRGLSEAVVRNISALKSEPQWMLDLRLKGLRLFDRKPMPNWGADLTGIDFQNIKYFVRSTEKQAATWDDLPADIKSTYDKLAAVAPRDPNVQLELAQAAQQSGNVTKAITAYERFLVLAPDDPSAEIVKQQIQQLKAAQAPAGSG